MSQFNTLKKLLTYCGALVLATACTDTKLFFSVDPVSCQVPTSSAKFGVNPGPVILYPTADTVATGQVNVTGSCVSGIPVLIQEISGKTTTVDCIKNVFATELQLSDGDGTKDLLVSQKTAADGSEIADRMCFMKDTIPPAVNISSENSAQSTNATSVPVSGTCESGLPVMLWGPGLSTPVSADCKNGTFSTVIPVRPGDGIKDIVGGQVDRAGNQGLASSTLSVDTVPPKVQITSAIPLVTNLASLEVSGTCEAGLPLEIGELHATTAPAVSCANGSFTANISLPVADGGALLRVFQVDTAGNLGSDSKNTIKDTVAPVVTIALPLANAYLAPTSTFSGACETGLPVELSGTALRGPKSIACSSGAWTLTSAITSGEGSKSLIATQTDGAGNKGQVQQSFTVDSLPPVLAITSPGANSYVGANFEVVGTCEMGLTVQISGSGILPATSASCPNGTFTASVAASPLDGVKQVTATQIDLGGNTSSAERNFLRDTLAPRLTIISPVAGTSVPANFVLSGSCESGLTIHFSGAGLASQASTVCSNAGAYSVNLNLSAGDGSKIIAANEVDGAGNESTAKTNYLRDSTPPKVAITSPAANSPGQGDLTVSGTCEAGLNVTLAGSGVATAVVVPCSAQGDFSASIFFTAGSGVKLITAAQTDSSGNVGSDSRNFMSDLTAPTITISSPAANSYLAANFTVQGTCEGGLPVTVSGPGLSTATTVPCNAGTYSASVTVSAGDGAKIVKAEQTDAAGNVASTSKSYLRDTLAPVLTITSPLNGTIAQNGVLLTGACETGLTVTFSGAGLSSSSSLVCAANTYQAQLTFSANDGSKVINLSETDAAGNNTQLSGTYVRDNTAPVVEITTPVAETPAQNGLTVGGTCQAGLNVTLAGTGMATPVVVLCSTTGSFSADISFSSGSGVKLVTASQTDSVGNTGTSSRSFARDLTSPTITITAPAANSYLSTNFTLEGACEKGLQVTVTGAGISAPVTVPCATGTYSADLSVSTGEGSKTVTAQQTDLSGNGGQASQTFLRDTLAPILSIISPANGTIARNGILLAGACETGLTVAFSGVGLSSPSSVVCTSNSYQAILNFSANDGSKVINVSETDAAGNSTQVSGSYVRDTTPPTVAITSPAANTQGQEGLTIGGTCEAGLDVTLNGAGVLTPVVVSCSASGAFSADILFSSGGGAKVVTASQTDSVGNIGTSSRSFARDLTPPGITITLPAANSYLAVNFTVQGACETGLAVIVGGTGISAATTVPCTAAAYSADVTVSAGEGSKTVTAQQTDLAGNVATTSKSYLRDTLAPVLTITSPANGTVAQNGVLLTGACETGLTVAFSGAGISAPSSVVCAADAYQAQITFSANDGSKVIIVSETDAAGNKTQVSGTYVRDTSPPAVAITSPAANTQAQNGLTVGGTCEAGLNVTLNGSGVLVPVFVSCSANGIFSAEILFSPGSGAKLVTASQSDSLGNTGSSSRSFVRDLTPPAITITSPAANSYLPVNFTVQGACETGLAVTVSGAGISAATTVPCNSAAYSADVTVSAGDGTKNITAQQTDSSGNKGQAAKDFLRDTLAPALSITSPGNGTVAKSGVLLVGACETGLSVTFSGAGVSSPSSVVCASNAYKTQLSFSAGDGNKVINVSETDAAGNSSQISGTYVRDATPPLVAITTPAADTPAQNGLTIGGTCEAGLNVTLAGTGVSTPVVVACIASGLFSGDITFTSGGGAKVVTASQTDGVGNTGSSSRSFVRDLTPPTVTLTSPAANSYLPTNFTVQGACETGLAVTVSGAGLSTPATVPCTSGAYSAVVTVSIGEGTKNIIAQQTDLSGNGGQASQNFLRDSVAPVLIITSPAPSSSVPISTNLIGTCETGITVMITGDLNSSSGSCVSGAFNIPVTFSTGLGGKNVLAKQTDMAGNVGQANATYSRDSNGTSETFVSDASFGKIDILFIDDNSASMDPKQASLGTKFSGFVTELLKIDWQIGITTTDCSAGPYGICGSLLPLTGINSKILTPSVANYQTVFNNSIQRPETAGCLSTGTCPSGNSEPLLSATTAMNKYNTDNNGFFRANADLAIVILSDADERQTGGANYANRPTQLVAAFNNIWPSDKKLKVYSIIVKPGDASCLSSMKAGSGGFSFFGDLIDQTVNLTSGLSTSICAPDYSLTLKGIGESVRTLTNSVELAHTPVANSVVVSFTPNQSIGFKVIGNKVVFDSPPSVGTEIKVDYQY
ncbi:MAG TPA: hypothetical protein VIG33_10115 [Pseudobdellovibrionaceae bacterium]|jgi:hypothetical protein